MTIKTILLTATAAAAAATLSACGSSDFPERMMALCLNPPAGRDDPGLISGRDCTCTVNAMDAGLTSDEKELVLAATIAADRRQAPAARTQAEARLRAAGLDLEREPAPGTPAAAFADKLDQITRDIRRNCPHS